MFQNGIECISLEIYKSTVSLNNYTHFSNTLSFTKQTKLTKEQRKLQPT